eukprot:4470579-Alexandrium_andersonii.AAC.1
MQIARAGKGLSNAVAAFLPLLKRLVAQKLTKVPNPSASAACPARPAPTVLRRPAALHLLLDDAL